MRDDRGERAQGVKDGLEREMMNDILLVFNTLIFLMRFVVVDMQGAFLSGMEQDLHKVGSSGIKGMCMVGRLIPYGNGI